VDDLLSLGLLGLLVVGLLVISSSVY